jgi:hypothetical protein
MTPIQVAGPASLIAALPYLLGFRPADSLVCVLLTQDSITGCVRYELDQNQSQLFELIANTLTKHEYDALVVVVISESLSYPTQELIAAFAAAEISLLDFLVTNLNSYRSALCRDLTCCPETGTEITQAQRDLLAAQLVASGHVAAESREQLVARLDSQPLPEIELETRVQILTAAELIAALSNWYRGPLSGSQIVSIATALADPELRNDLEYELFDSVAGELTKPERLRTAAENLRQCAVSLPTQAAAMSYGVLAFCYWNLGDWVLAQIAASKSLALDSSNSPARLTNRLLQQQIDPVTARSQIFSSAA